MAEKKKKLKKLIKWVILVIIVLGIVIFFVLKNKNSNVNTIFYITEAAQKQVFEDYIEVSGSVISDYSNIVKAEASEEILSINVKEGDYVEKDQDLLILDASSYNDNILNAKNSLEIAKLNLESLKEPASDLAILRSEQAVAQAKQNLEDLELKLDRKYDSSLNTLDSVYLSKSRNILYLSELYITYSKDDDKYIEDNSSIWDVEIPEYWKNLLSTESNFYDLKDKEDLEKYIRTATLYYKKAKSIYNKNSSYYYEIKANSEESEIETLIEKTKEISDSIYDLLRSENILYDFWIDYNNEHLRTIFYNLITYQNLLKQITPTINSHVSTMNNLLYSENGSGILNMKQSIENSEVSLKIQEDSLLELKKEPDYKDLRSREISVTQAQNNLNTLYKNLSKYYIKAPNSGIVAALNVDVGDSINSGTQILIINSDKKTIEALVNETYISKIKEAQEVEIKFDIFVDTVFSGEVISVSRMPEEGYSELTYYKVVVSIDNDENIEKYNEIRDGMSSDIKIIVSRKEDLLLVSSFSLKEDSNGFYVEVLKNDLPEKKYVKIGDYNDFNYEILSGIEVGENIITRTIDTSSSAAKNIIDMINMGSGTGTVPQGPKSGIKK
jgi:multidrug efflux pump subunit AcrA (membrane-fusion protein)